MSTVPELHADAGSTIAPRAAEGRVQQRDWVRWAFLLPTVLLLFVITIYPMLNSLWNSLHYYNLLAPDDTRFVGLGNYVDLLRNDPTFWVVMEITFIYTIGVVAIQFIAGLGMALLLDRAMRGISPDQDAHHHPDPHLAGRRWPDLAVHVRTVGSHQLRSREIRRRTD